VFVAEVPVQASRHVVGVTVRDQVACSSSAVLRNTSPGAPPATICPFWNTKQSRRQSRDNIQIVRGSHYRLRAAGPADQEIVSPCSGFSDRARRSAVHQQHFRVEDKYRGQRHPLLPPPESRCGERSFRCEISNISSISPRAGESILRQRSARAKATSSNTGAEQLDVRV
jgi:hypothetical protein